MRKDKKWTIRDIEQIHNGYMFLREYTEDENVCNLWDLITSRDLDFLYEKPDTTK